MATLRGSTGNDVLTGGVDNDLIEGLTGDDTLSGGAGADTVYGGGGSDMVSGGDGDDFVSSESGLGSQTVGGYGLSWTIPGGVEFWGARDTVLGGAGNDRLLAGFGDYVDGGTNDYVGDRLSISFTASPVGLAIDTGLSNQTIDITTILNIESYDFVIGSDQADTFTNVGTTASTFAATLDGRGGNDLFRVGSAAYIILAGEGNDTVDGAGSTYMYYVGGGSGDDTITFSSYVQLIDGQEGNDVIQGNGGIVHGGRGNDRITSQSSFYSTSLYGDQDDDEIIAGDVATLAFGGSGADTVTGGKGDDTLGSADHIDSYSYPYSTIDLDMTAERDIVSGGAGNDYIAVGYGDDADGGAGTDRLVLSLGGASAGVTFDATGLLGSTPFTFAGGTISNFEAITLLRGSDFADTITIGVQTDLFTVDAGGGNDVVITGGSSASVKGGDGNDRFVSGIAGDIFDGGAGVDVVDYSGYATAVTVALSDTVITGSGPGGDQLVNIENVTGSAFGDDIRGNAVANALDGGAGNDTLDGGQGADTLTGGAGDDLYYVDSAGDVVIEAAGQGNDRLVVSAGSYQLGVGAEVETLSAAAGSAAVNIAGNGYAQVINGNDGANILSTGGGGAADTMNGGLGNDTYRVFSTGDVIEDTGGFDTVYASGTSYFLYSTASVEYVSTSEQAGTQGFYLVGNGAAQVIAGNYGDNILNGRGTAEANGAGDTLIGLYGNDTYRVAGQADVVREVDGQGSDVVYVAGDYQLRQGASVEAISADDQTASGAGVTYTIRGNELAQTVVGNDAANVLDGRGGNDVLVGRGGGDTFAFTSALGAGNVDTIQDFAAEDRIGLASDVFAAVTAGGIVAGELVVGSAALDADDRLVYDQASGKLSYDADGNGAGAAVLFAQLAAGTVLGVASFTIVAPIADIPAV